MKNYKKIIAGTMALGMCLSMAACGDSNSETVPDITTTEATSWTGDNIEVEALEETVDVDISGKTLKWMGFYDLNPTNDSPERSPELALFEDTYGAKIEYMVTTNGTRFDDLATAILGGNPPDIFAYEWRTFPYDISKGQFQAIDSLIDWEEPKWADVKDIADKFIWKGEHYIAPLGYSFNDTQVLMYNTSTVENEGFEDPYQLYLDGKWDWDHFVDMMKTYVENGDGNERYGIGGWWANAFVYTAGDTMVTYDGNKFTNNLRSAQIEKAQIVLEDIFKSNLIKRGWIGGESAFVDDDLLFYSMGTWAYNAAALSRPDDTIQIVPFPKNPDLDTYYVSNKVYSYMWVRGSENGDCVKAWLDCNRTVNFEDTYVEATKQKFLANNEGWTSEMYDLAMDFYDDSKFTQAYDYGYGLSTYMSDEVMNLLYQGIADEQFESWVVAREELYSIVDEEVNAYSE
ncbi:MAG: ABC transporter substrate-binding protein [Huintestinicola sp.]